MGFKSVFTDKPLLKIDNIAVVCHDAGAANIIIANLLDTGRNDWRSYMQGPAEKLWNAAYPGIKLCDSLDSTLEGVDLLVTGTGWGSEIEHEARRLARLFGIHSVALIDHWVNYEERFVRDGRTVWPDEFWVTDDYAEEIAKRIFPGQAVLKVPNCYLDTQLELIAQMEKPDTPEILYVLEPTRSDWGRETLGEFQALDYFVSHLPQLQLPLDTVIRLRLHPSENHEKYDEWVAAHPTLNIKLDETFNITQSMGRSSWVAGCESFALVLALMAGRIVYCALPPWAPACRLPHQGLIHLRKQLLE
ncbi:MAG: hypothetical protein DRR42_21650 [Gammaproteobacteria bacterium]|nr:MAG: hypothetical protein DRR42_21650 [Gammaproteobacteria bacterium]